MLSSPPPSPQPAGAVDTFGEGGAGSGGGLAEEPRSLRLVTKSHGTVVVQRAHFHNLVERNGCYFHVAPEATSPGGKVQLCSRCSRCRSRTARDFTRRESEGVIDPHFLQHNPSFYRHGAPPDCIASGYDVGARFLRGAGDGDAVIDLADTSALEMLCLASHRLHHVSSKLASAIDKGGGRRGWRATPSSSRRRLATAPRWPQATRRATWRRHSGRPSARCRRAPCATPVHTNDTRSCTHAHNMPYCERASFQRLQFLRCRVS